MEQNDLRELANMYKSNYAILSDLSKEYQLSALDLQIIIDTQRNFNSVDLFSNRKIPKDNPHYNSEKTIDNYVPTIRINEFTLKDLCRVYVGLNRDESQFEHFMAQFDENFGRLRHFYRTNSMKRLLEDGLQLYLTRGNLEVDSGNLEFES